MTAAAVPRHLAEHSSIALLRLERPTPPRRPAHEEVAASALAGAPPSRARLSPSGKFTVQAWDHSGRRAEGRRCAASTRICTIAGCALSPRPGRRELLHRGDEAVRKRVDEDGERCEANGAERRGSRSGCSAKRVRWTLAAMRKRGRTSGALPGSRQRPETRPRDESCSHSRGVSTAQARPLSEAHGT